MQVTRIQSGGIRIKTSPEKFEEDFSTTYNIKAWGADNLFPNIFNNMIQASPTASTCVRKKARFIEGKGIEGGDAVMVNYSQTLNDLIAQLADNSAKFGGFALHCQYDGLGNITAIRNIDIEKLRLGECDSFGYIPFVLWCQDWTGESTQNGQQINPIVDCVKYFPFSISREATLRRMYGDNKPNEADAQKYNGEIFYFSNRDYYPTSCAMNVLTDISTDTGLCNINYRNTRANFLPSAIIAYQRGETEQNQQFLEAIAKMQGDSNAGKILAVGVDDMESAPKSIDLQLKNFDKDFSVTADRVESRIYSVFEQETFYLLKQGKIGFGGQVIQDAYNSYDVAISKERSQIENALKKIQTKFISLQGIDIKIQPLKFNADENTNTAK